MMLAIAGKLNAETLPCTALSTTSIQISARPVTTRNAMAPCDIADVTLENCSTSSRGNRSAMTPPHSISATIGIVCAARTWPSALGSSVISSTANASAMVAIIEPSRLTVREAK